MKRNVEKLVSREPEETRAAAARLAAQLEPGAVVALFGPLGAGKTCFVQGLAEALGVDEPVTSPTYTLANEYRGRLPVYHIDLYRIDSPDQALDLGVDEYFEGRGITLIEWAERAEELFPPRTVRVALQHGATDGERHLTLEVPSP